MHINIIICIIGIDTTIIIKHFSTTLLIIFNLYIKKVYVNKIVIYVQKNIGSKTSAAGNIMIPYHHSIKPIAIEIKRKILLNERCIFSPPSGAFEDMRAESSCKCTTLEKEEIVERTRRHFGRVDSIKHQPARRRQCLQIASAPIDNS